MVKAFALVCLVCALLAVKGSADLPVSKGKMVEYPLNSRLFYAFDLKVAHHETELPAAKVRPQTVSSIAQCQKGSWIGSCK